MLEICERITWGVGLVLIAALAGYLGVAGAPTTVPAILTQSRRVSRSEMLNKLAPEVKNELEKIASAPRRACTKGAGAVGGRGAARGGRGPGAVHEAQFIEVNRATYERVRNLTDAINEGKNARSRVRDNPDGTNSLEVFDFRPNSLLRRVGFEEHDVIDQINGQNIDFRNRRAAMNLFHECRDKLEAGIPIVVDVTRRGNPMQIYVGLKSER